MPSCDCHIEVTDSSQRRILWVLLGVNATMFVVEFIVSVLADSTGVLADSIDMLADAFVYGVALYAVGRGSSIKIRAALLSGVFQILIACGIVVDILRRTVTGSEPSSLLMFAVSCLALVANVYCLSLISAQKQGEVHMRASFIFSKNDVLANTGVILASILIHFTGTRWPDLVIGAIITILVLRGGLQIIADAKRQKQAEQTGGGAGTFGSESN